MLIAPEDGRRLNDEDRGWKRITKSAPGNQERRDCVTDRDSVVKGDRSLGRDLRAEQRVSQRCQRSVLSVDEAQARSLGDRGRVDRFGTAVNGRELRQIRARYRSQELAHPVAAVVRVGGTVMQLRS